jgi:hypothetical protein
MTILASNWLLFSAASFLKSPYITCHAVRPTVKLAIKRDPILVATSLALNIELAVRAVSHIVITT